MSLDEAKKTRKEPRLEQEGINLQRGTSEHEVGTSACRHNFAGRSPACSLEADFFGSLIESEYGLFKSFPICSGRKIHLDDARIGNDRDAIPIVLMGWRVTL